MADNKLFYKVGESNAESFKTVKKDESVIGLINPREGSASNFGYFISGGKQYGPSYHDIEQIAAAKAESAKQYADVTFAKSADITGQFAAIDTKFNDYALKSEISDIDTKPNGTGSFSADGVDYTISFDENGTISVSKYIATSVSSVSLDEIKANKTATGGGRFYVGYTYTVNVGIDVTSTEQKVSATFKNDTKQAFEVKIHDGSTYCYTYSMPAGLANPSVTYFAPTYYIMKDVTNQTYTGVVQYNQTYTPSVDTTDEKTFTVYAYDGKTTKSSYKKQSNINASVSVSSKTIFAYGTNKDYVLTHDNYISKVYKDGDNTYASSADYNDASKPSSVTIPSGTPTVIFHKSLGTPTFKQMNSPISAWKFHSEVEVAGVYDNIGTNDNKIKAPAYYLIYQYNGVTQDEGTWDITWS